MHLYITLTAIGMPSYMYINNTGNVLVLYTESSKANISYLYM